MSTPETIGRYRVIALIGEGGMGRVYLAEDSSLGRRVAIKVLTRDSQSDADRARRFLQEARLASAISHPNIAQIFEIGDADGTPYIAMEYVEGQTLSSRLTGSGPFKSGEVLEIAIQTFDALDEAHARGIVHRDLKPANIAITPRGRVKVLDFGLATLAQAHPSASAANTDMNTRPGVILGTVHYMSPEQALGRDVDGRSDIFSAGILLYELLTGRLPFAGGSVTETLDRIVHAQPDAIARLNYEIPPELERIVRKALEKDPARRYQTARDTLVDLTNLKRDSDSGVKRSSKTPRSKSSGRGIASIAVLPLVVTTADAAADYLADGITESVIHALSQIPKLKVMARSTVFRYQGREINPQAIGRELGVRAVLTGRLQSLGGRLIVRAELVDVEDGSHLWGGHVQRQSADVLTLQEDLAAEIVDQLRIRLTRDDRQRLKKRPTQNAVAYEAYLRGRFQLAKRTAEGFSRAIECFEQATVHDPNFALAYTGLADAFTLLASAGYAGAPADAIEKARRAAERAIRLDDTLAEAHQALGFLRFRIDWDWPAAEASLKRACELNPGHPPAHHSYALFLSAMGRADDAIAEIRRAAELDPLSLIIGTAHGRILHFGRRYDDALAQFQRTIEIDAQFVQVHFDRGLTYAATNRYADAIAEFERHLEPSDRRSVLVAALGYSYARDGQTDRARQILSELQARCADGRATAADLGYVQAGLGEIDAAVDSFDRAYNARVGLLVFLKVEPMVDALRSHPRFQALIARMKLI